MRLGGGKNRIRFAVSGVVVRKSVSLTENGSFRPLCVHGSAKQTQQHAHTILGILGVLGKRLRLVNKPAEVRFVANGSGVRTSMVAEHGWLTLSTLVLL